MTPLDAQPVLDAALRTVNACRLDGPCGRYRSTANDTGGPDPWAGAAVVNLLYAMDILPGRNHDRLEWVEHLQSLQDPESGRVNGESEDERLLLTAAVVSALSCFGCGLPAPPREALAYTDSNNLKGFLRDLGWCQGPERAARKLGALFTTLVLTEEAGPEWEASFFNWIHEEADEHTGLLRKECLAPVELDGHWTLLPYLCAFLYPLAASAHAREAHPLPWRLVDTALEVMEYHRDLFFQPRGQRHLPWVYCLTRSRKLTAHRFEEGRQALERFAPAYLDFLMEQIRTERFDSPTHIQWDLAVLAELQIHLPGLIRTRRPLRPFLDRHPFL